MASLYFCTYWDLLLWCFIGTSSLCILGLLLFFTYQMIITCRSLGTAIQRFILCSQVFCFDSRLFPVEQWFICSIKQISLCRLVYIDPASSKQWRSAAIMHHSTVVVLFPPPVIIYVIHSCGCDTEHMHRHRTPKQSELSSERVAPKHVGYVETSKTHDQFGHMLEIETYFTPGL